MKKIENINLDEFTIDFDNCLKDLDINFDFDNVLEDLNETLYFEIPEVDDFKDINLDLDDTLFKIDEIQ